MKPNRLWLLPLAAMMIGGCASNYHGPEYQGTPNHLPPAFWDSPFEGAEAMAAPGSSGQGIQTTIANCTAPCELPDEGQESQGWHVSFVETISSTR
jgi:hypothetical protein